MSREMPEEMLNEEDVSEETPENNDASEDVVQQESKELTPEEKTDRALKETVKVFKEELNPKQVIGRVKKFFGK